MLFIFKSLMNHIVEICNVWAESKSYQWCLIVYTKYLQGKASILSYRRLSLILVFNSLEMLPTVFQTFPDLSTRVFSHCEGISTFPLHFKLLLQLQLFYPKIPVFQILLDCCLSTGFVHVVLNKFMVLKELFVLLQELLAVV